LLRGGGKGMSTIEDFSDAKKELDKANLIVAVYENPVQSAFMHGVLSIVPFAGAATDSLVGQQVFKFQSDKEKQFIEIINSNTDLITMDMVKNERFLIHFGRCMEAIRRLASNGKIEYYGNLLCNGYLNENTISVDDFDEYESILNDLSEREIHYLVVFADFARKNNRELSGKTLQNYISNMQSLYPSLSPIQILKRLQRTGFITDAMAWIEHGEDTNSDGTLKLGAGNAYVLDSSYDDFERIVLRTFNEGR